MTNGMKMFMSYRCIALLTGPAGDADRGPDTNVRVKNINSAGCATFTQYVVVKKAIKT